MNDFCPLEKKIILKAVSPDQAGMAQMLISNYMTSYRLELKDARPDYIQMNYVFNYNYTQQISKMLTELKNLSGITILTEL